MQTISVEEISKILQRLSPEKLLVVNDFVNYLADRESPVLLIDDEASAIECTLVSESALRANWESPEEDAAWAHL